MMKKITIILVFLAVFTIGDLSAQHYIGVRGGWGGGSARFFPAREMGYEWGLYSGGLTWKYYSAEKYIGGVQADLQYMEKGFNYDEFRDADTSYHRRLKSIELPFMWQPHLYFLKRHAKFFVNLGVQFSYNFDSEEQLISKTKGVLSTNKYPFLLTRDNRWGYGLVGGAGLSVLFGRFEILVEGRYYFGYSDILRNKTKYETNPVRSPLDNINVSMGLCYRLGKGGIRSAPSKGVAARMAAAETKRLMKQQQKLGLPPMDSTVVVIPGTDSTTIAIPVLPGSDPEKSVNPKAPQKQDPSAKPETPQKSKTIEQDGAASGKSRKSSESVVSEKQKKRDKQAVPEKSAKTEVKQEAVSQ